MHSGTAAVTSRTRGALLPSRGQAGVAEARRRTLAADEMQASTGARSAPASRPHLWKRQKLRCRPSSRLRRAKLRRLRDLAFYMGCYPHRRKDRVSLGKRGCAATCSALRAGACRLRRRRKARRGRVLRVGPTAPVSSETGVSLAPVATPATEAAAARLAVDRSGRCSLSHRVSAQKRSPNLCKNATVVFSSDRDPPCR
jgi:hypothetical protein